MEDNESQQATEELARTIAEQLNAGIPKQDIVNRLSDAGMPSFEAQQFVEYVDSLRYEAKSQAGTKDLMWGGGFLAGGAAITIGTWVAAEPGGGYWVMWGLIGYGLFRMICGFYKKVTSAVQRGRRLIWIFGSVMFAGGIILGGMALYDTMNPPESVLTPSELTLPTVGNVPQGWYLSADEPYGTYENEEDGTKWGLVSYTDDVDADFVMIFYGKVPSELKGRENDSAALIARAIFEATTIDDPDETGTMTVAGQLAGYAKAYSATYDVYKIEIVFVKGSTCVAIYTMYDATSEDEAQVMSLINSIDF